jgi:tetratricopeptide (TPR) repeat protein
MSTAAEDGYLVEADKRLSESMLFHLQRRFYDMHGQGAWEIVPSYVTNNPSIALSYAHVTMAYLRDALAAGMIDRSQPIYVVELSAGSGRFGFLYWKKLLEMKRSSSLSSLDLRFVLTDFTESNLKAWQQNPLLRRFIDEGNLELGLFDITSDRAIRLASGAVLSPETVKNPLVLLANYAFDVWPQDFFRVDHGALHEVRVSLRHRSRGAPDLSRPRVVGSLKLSFSLTPVDREYYGDPEIDRILGHYLERLTDTTVAIPIAAFHGLRRLFDIAGRRVLLIASDKALTQEDQIVSLDMTMIDLHGGSFSTVVNYHAVGQFFVNQGGIYACSQRFSGLQTAVFVLGGDERRFPETVLAYREHVDEFSPWDSYMLLAHQHRECTSFTLEHFLTLLRLSRWDPLVVHEFGGGALEQAQDAPEMLKEQLRQALERVWDNFFPVDRDLPFELARFSLALKRPDEAVRWGTVSLEMFGDHAVTWANLGLAHYHAERPEEALRCFERSIALAPAYASPKAWRALVLGELEGRESPA